MDTLTRQMDSLKSLPLLPQPESEAVFQAVLALWRKRLALTPDPSLAYPFVPQGERGEFTSSFPWAQVKRSLAALVTDYPPTPDNGGEKPHYWGQGGNPVLALICAGNTPLLAWPAMLFAVRHGVKLYVKMSRDETLWPRLLKESVAEVSPEAAARIELGVWPGEDERTEKLIEHSGAVIAYGSDATIERLKTLAGEKPFEGFGHALSVGLWGDGPDADFNEWLPWIVRVGKGFSEDILTFDQSGCLSPCTIFVQKIEEAVRSVLVDEWLAPMCVDLQMKMRTDSAECRRVREERDLATMEGAKVFGDSELRWTVISWPQTREIPTPVGLGIVHLIPLDDLSRFGNYLGSTKGRLSSVGVAGEVSPELRAAIEAEGVSRICKAGEMQTPPLDWRNGGVDLEAWIAKLGREY